MNEITQYYDVIAQLRHNKNVDGSDGVAERREYFSTSTCCGVASSGQRLGEPAAS